MRPSFNIAGPCLPEEHYMLPPERRLGRVRQLIEDRKYLTLHAGRQTGKTTSAFWLVDHLNASGQFKAIWVDLETAREQPDPQRAFRTILAECNAAFERQVPEIERPSREEIDALLEDPARALREYLTTLTGRSSLPLVVLFDEADGLVGPAMVSFLTQLRAGYLNRSRAPFPSSVVLIGLRPVRDYALLQEDRRTLAWLGTTSPFNVSAESATLASFTRAEVEELLTQHTTATGQPFTPHAMDRIHALGQGHPWLTNALAEEAVGREVPDRAQTVTAGRIDAAKETLILQRRSHIDSLIHRLREPRVQKIIAPMLAGEHTGADVVDDDLDYVVGLGLVRMQDGFIEVANPIYREIIPRALTHLRQAQIHQAPRDYVRPDGGLDMGRLLQSFQQFWRKDGHLAAEGFDYREAGPHLMLMAFLQRIVNGGGRVEREYGLGRGALDLMVLWNDERYAIEVKLRRDTHTEEDALDQIAGYLDTVGLDEGWLVLFDLRKRPSWAEKLTHRDVEHAEKRIHIFGA